MPGIVVQDGCELHQMDFGPTGLPVSRKLFCVDAADRPFFRNQLTEFAAGGAYHHSKATLTKLDLTECPGARISRRYCGVHPGNSVPAGQLPPPYDDRPPTHVRASCEAPS